ncbi:hypothetical protein [Glycomyces paridis]|uniref:Uncharacterized protein n=1 Tax=Glycomyces paridis TaxID=2126555 RepID=A0A4S8PN47_9ACTN|nr:hypothetical protein [Glycomyces paridis]THV30069.1 hypothetical protein E9998_06745 [Glycomyces paridis]
MPPRQTAGAGRRRIAAAAAAFALALASASCDFENPSSDGSGEGVFYALGDDHRLYRWDAAGGSSGEPEPVLDLSGVWEGQGDVGTVLRASLSIAPGQKYAAWIDGASPGAVLEFGNLETGEITTGAAYPVDHACIDPSWLADGSALLVHRAAVWGIAGEPGGRADTDAIPLPAKTWGATEWYSPEAGELPTTMDLTTQGCRLRWYTDEDGAAQALYHDLDVTELYRVDATGSVLETIPVPSLKGTEPLTIGLVGVDPSGRYACLVDGYGPYGAYKGGFTIRAESGTRVVDLEERQAVGADDTTCVSVHADGYVSRDGTQVAFIDYTGRSLWATDLPDTIAESPVLFYFPPD